MREIVLDTETTGLRHKEGDRLVEIGCIELIDTKPTGEKFHRYLNPERDVPQEAIEIHGLTAERLRGEPRFIDIVDELLNFLGDAQLVIHNAEFDMAFLNMELQQIGRPTLESNPVVDTLKKARTELQEKKVYSGSLSLDALCKYYNIAEKPRGLHGALLDADLLVKVYQKLCGFDEQLGMNLAAKSVKVPNLPVSPQIEKIVVKERPSPLPPRLNNAEVEAHKNFIATFGDKDKKPLWKY